MTKLTSAIKKRITRDWQEYFPELGEYKPMWIMKRAGCLIVGIALERDSSNSVYHPTVHTHVLGKGFPVVSLTLAQRLVTEKTQAPEAIRATHHDKHIPEACERLRRQCPLPLSGPMQWSEIEKAYTSQISKQHFPLELHEDLILIAAWWAPASEARVFFQTVADRLAAWPGAIFADGYNRWREKFSQLVTDRQLLEKSVSIEVDRLRLETLPTFSVQWDAGE